MTSILGVLVSVEYTLSKIATAGVSFNSTTWLGYYSLWHSFSIGGGGGTSVLICIIRKVFVINSATLYQLIFFLFCKRVTHLTRYEAQKLNTKRHKWPRSHMYAYEGNGGLHPLVHILGTRWNWVVRFAPPPSPSEERTRDVLWIWRCKSILEAKNCFVPTGNGNADFPYHGVS